MLKLARYILAYWKKNLDHVDYVFDHWNQIGPFERMKYRIMTRILVYTAAMHGYKANDREFVKMIFEGGEK